MKIEDQVKNLIQQDIEQNNYKLDSVTYNKEGNIYYLTVIIDKEGYVDVEDCVAVSKIINPILDNVDLISDSYILDVCSKEKRCE
ncbi:MAG: ribosome maturation factor RimP [Ignavibacteriales bacterium]